MKPTQLFNLKGNPEIRALDINPQEGKVLVAGFDQGEIYQYEGSVPLSPNIPFVQTKTLLLGQPKTRCIKYWKSRDEIVVGCEGGYIAVYSLSNLEEGPICKTLVSTFLTCRLI